MNKNKIKIFLLLSLCFGTVALTSYIALINDIYVFPTILFHSFLTQEAIVSGFLFIFFLLLLILFLSLLNNKYFIVFFCSYWICRLYLFLFSICSYNK